MIVRTILSQLVGFVFTLFGNRGSTEPTSYVGSYKLTAVYDEYQEAITIPTRIRDFEFKIKKAENFINDSNAFDFDIIVANTIGGPMTITTSEDGSNETDSVQIDDLCSTKMMPPDDVYPLEIGVTRILGAAETIKFSETNNKLLTLNGTMGRIEGIKYNSLT